MVDYIIFGHCIFPKSRAQAPMGRSTGRCAKVGGGRFRGRILCAAEGINDIRGSYPSTLLSFLNVLQTIISRETVGRAFSRSFHPFTTGTFVGYVTSRNKYMAFYALRNIKN